MNKKPTTEPVFIELISDGNGGYRPATREESTRAATACWAKLTKIAHDARAKGKKRAA